MMYAVRQDPETKFWQVEPVDRIQGEALLGRGYPHVYETPRAAYAVRHRLNIEYGVPPTPTQAQREQVKKRLQPIRMPASSPARRVRPHIPEQANLFVTDQSGVVSDESAYKGHSGICESRRGFRCDCRLPSAFNPPRPSTQTVASDLNLRRSATSERVLITPPPRPVASVSAANSVQQVDEEIAAHTVDSLTQTLKKLLGGS